MNMALVRSLLEKHSIKDVHALMKRCVSGQSPTLEQVRTVRREMLAAGAKPRPKNVSLAHIFNDPPAPIPVAEPVVPMRTYFDPSASLLRRQLQAGQHFITDRARFEAVCASVGLAA